jgi:hypothetical protein
MVPRALVIEYHVRRAEGCLLGGIKRIRQARNKVRYTGNEAGRDDQDAEERIIALLGSSIPMPEMALPMDIGGVTKSMPRIIVSS